MGQFSQNYETNMLMLNSLMIKNPKNLYDYKNNLRIIEQMIIVAKSVGDTEKENKLSNQYNEIKDIIKVILQK